MQVLVLLSVEQTLTERHQYWVRRVFHRCLAHSDDSHQKRGWVTKKSNLINKEKTFSFRLLKALVYTCLNKHLGEKLSVKAPTLVRAKHSSHCDSALFPGDHSRRSKSSNRNYSRYHGTANAAPLLLLTLQTSRCDTRGEELAVLPRPMALPKRGSPGVWSPAVAFWGAEEEAVVLKKLFSCPVVPRSGKF